MIRFLFCCILFYSWIGLAQDSASPWKNLSPEQIHSIEGMLTPGPRGLGVPASDRAVWDQLARGKNASGVIRKAEGLIGKPLPAWEDEAFLDFSKTGRRGPGEKMVQSRRGRLPALVWAECLENKGRFIPEISKQLQEYLSEPTWVLPAHDGGLGNFKGTKISIDLRSSWTGYELAQVLWLLGDKLPADIRGGVMSKLEERIFIPFRKALKGESRIHWMTVHSNWNSVCLSGTIGAALAVLPDRADRAVFIAAGMHYGKNFLRGFTPDGYCSEGMGYWNYGFSRFLVMREHFWQATGGQIDFFQSQIVRNVAMYGVGTEIWNGIYPAIADCRPGTRPSEEILRYSNLALGLGLAQYKGKGSSSHFGNLIDDAIDLFPNSLTHAPRSSTSADLGLRTWFDKGGLLVSRPVKGRGAELGVAFKGGHNDEIHNHNDVGSFSIVLGNQMMLGDPGGPYVYNSKTFSSQRYTAFKLFSSEGHPVPRIAGKTQKAGADAKAVVLNTDFKEDADRLSLDIRSAYPVNELTRLNRDFILIRGENAAVGVRDVFEASQPVEFESALTTRAIWRKISATELEFSLEGQTLRCMIDAEGADIEITSETIEEDCIPFDRIGIRLVQPAAKGSITLRFVPLAKS